MKKFWVILVSLLCLVSCYNIKRLEPHYPKRTFYSEVRLGDSVFYYMNAVIEDEVEMEFVKKVVRKSNYGIHLFGPDFGCLTLKDTMVCLIESCSYTRERFRELLRTRNEQERDTTVMEFTPNMYIQWSTFDEMFEFCK